MALISTPAPKPMMFPINALPGRSRAAMNAPSSREEPATRPQSAASATLGVRVDPHAPPLRPGLDRRLVDRAGVVGELEGDGRRAAPRAGDGTGDGRAGLDLDWIRAVDRRVRDPAGGQILLQRLVHGGPSELDRPRLEAVAELVRPVLGDRDLGRAASAQLRAAGELGARRALHVVGTRHRGDRGRGGRKILLDPLLHLVRVDGVAVVVVVVTTPRHSGGHEYPRDEQPVDHWIAIASRSRSSGLIRWSASSASSPISICTQLMSPVNRLVSAM